MWKGREACSNRGRDDNSSTTWTFSIIGMTLYTMIMVYGVFPGLTSLAVSGQLVSTQLNQTDR